MGFWSILHLLSFACYICLITFILIKNPNDLRRRLCVAFISCFALWSYAEIFFHNPYSSRATAELANYFASVGWLAFGGIFLWLSLLLAEKRQLIQKKAFVPMLFLIPLILFVAHLDQSLAIPVPNKFYGWGIAWNPTFWIYLYFMYYLFCMGSGLFFLYRIKRTSPNPLKQKQAQVIFYSTLFALLGGTISDVAFPLLDIRFIPGLSDIFGLIWACGLVYAMARFNFLEISPTPPDNNIPTTMFDCLILLNAKGEITSLNDATLKLLGYKEDELRGKSFDFLLEKTHQEKPHPLLTEIIGYNNVKNRDLVFRSQEGKRIDVTFSSSLLQDEEGKIKSIVCVARDITELKRSDAIQEVLFHISEATRRSSTLQGLLELIQKQVARLMDARNFYVALVHDRDKAIYSFPFIVDINPEELEDTKDLVPLPHSFTDYVLRTETPLLADQKKYDELNAREEVHLIGSMPKTWMGVPLKTSEDKVLGVVVVQSYENEFAYSERDMEVLAIISNTIAGAIQYKQAEEALRQSEEHYRILIENIQDGVFIIKDKKFEFVNEAFARTIGYAIEELKHQMFTTFISPDDLPMVLDRYLRRLRGELVPSEYEFKMRHKNGTDIDVNMHVGLVNYKGDAAIMGTIKDVSERQRAEKKRLELEEKLVRSEKMEALGRLAGGVAHDLNNVLSAIVGYPDLLLLKLPPDSPMRKQILLMQQSGQKAAAIVQDLLTLARRGVIVKNNIPINTIINEYLLSPVFEKLSKYHPSVNVTARLAEPLSLIKGSAVHLSKTIMNLVSNAAEAMPKGGEITILTREQYFSHPVNTYYQVISPGAYIEVSISDTGTGIAAADLNKIFDPFYTKKEMGRSGTGLGMSVVWGTVEDHKGFIDVHSIVGQGTTFALYFPTTDEKAITDEVEIPIATYRGNGEKILVVDDEFDQQEIALAMLKELGYDGQSLSSGEAAINYMKTNQADLILLDMLMGPGLDGLDTYRELLLSHPGQKAIIVSGFSESQRVKEALALGVSTYIKKPYTLPKLGMTLAKQLKQQTVL